MSAPIHKGAYVTARLYVEGDEPPEQDFLQTVGAFVRRLLLCGTTEDSTPYRVTWTAVTVDDDPGDEEERV